MLQELVQKPGRNPLADSAVETPSRRAQFHLVLPTRPGPTWTSSSVGTPAVSTHMWPQGAARGGEGGRGAATRRRAEEAEGREGGDEGGTRPSQYCRPPT